MAMYTNVSQRLIHAPDATMMIPGQPVEVSDECGENQGFKDLVDSGDIVAGEVPAEQLEKVRQEREVARQEHEDITRQEQHAQPQQPAPQQQQPQRQAPPIQQQPRREA